MYSIIIKIDDLYYIGAYLGLVLVQWTLKRGGQKFRLESKYLLFGEVVCFILGWDIFLTSIIQSSNPNYLSMFALYLLLTFYTTSFLMSHDAKNIAVTACLCAAIGFVVAILGYPIFKMAGKGMDVFYIFWWGGSSSFFYLIIPINSMVSGFFCYFWSRYMDVIRIKVLGREHLERPNAKLRSIATYVQIVPIGLLPIFTIQLVLGPSYVQGATLTLYRLYASQLLPVLICISIALLGKRIFLGNFLKITSIFALLSFIAVLYSAFQTVVLNVNSGTFLIALIVTSLFSCAVGIGLSRSVY